MAHDNGSRSTHDELVALRNRVRLLEDAFSDFKRQVEHDVQDIKNRLQHITSE